MSTIAVPGMSRLHLCWASPLETRPVPLPRAWAGSVTRDRRIRWEQPVPVSHSPSMPANVLSSLEAQATILWGSPTSHVGGPEPRPLGHGATWAVRLQQHPRPASCPE